MIEQRVTKELNKEQIDLKIAGLYVCDNIIVVMPIILSIIVFFAILGIFNPEREIILNCLLKYLYINWVFIIKTVIY